MDVLKFTLGGKSAFFKRPDVNTYFYFTYGCIHKVALLGIFGAILGYKGYNQMMQHDIYPEFYDKLKKIKVSIIPNYINISKKVQTFNNSVGYASGEQGGNLIVKEQWLENPSWSIYVLLDSDEAKSIAKAIVENNFIYIPYLGKNDHIADIIDAKVINDIVPISKYDNIDSLFIKGDFVIDSLMEYEDDFDSEPAPIYKYEEQLPISLDEDVNKYNFHTFILTNARIKNTGEREVYKCEDRNIVFI